MKIKKTLQLSRLQNEHIGLQRNIIRIQIIHLIQFFFKIIRQNKNEIWQAVLAFLKIITSIQISKKIEKYKNNAGLYARMKDNDIQIGFGLHMGWNIEGVIGSSFKIDFSYFSSNFDITFRFGAVTKYGVLKQYLTDECQKQLRIIDMVTVEENIESIEIHTINISIKNLIQKLKYQSYKFDTSKMNQKEQQNFMVINRFKKNNYKKMFITTKLMQQIFLIMMKNLCIAENLLQKYSIKLRMKGFNIMFKVPGVKHNLYSKKHYG